MSQVEMAGRTHFVLEIPRRAQIVHSENARVEEHEIGLQAPRDKHTDIQTDRHTDRHTYIQVKDDDDDTDGLSVCCHRCLRPEEFAGGPSIRRAGVRAAVRGGDQGGQQGPLRHTGRSDTGGDRTSSSSTSTCMSLSLSLTVS